VSIGRRLAGKSRVSGQRHGVPVMEIRGIEEVTDLIMQVTPSESRNILRRTTVHIARVVRDAVRERTPVGPTGNLKRSIKSKRNKDERTLISAQVYADRSGGRSGKGYHSHLVEFGTRPRQKSSGANSGTMPDKPFINPAADSLRAEIPSMYREQFGKELEKELAKRATRAKK